MSDQRLFVMVLYGEGQGSQALIEDLRAHHWPCIRAQNIQQAKGILSHQSPDVVIWHPSACEVRVLSALGPQAIFGLVPRYDEVLTAELLELGAAEIMPEPFSKAELFWRLRRLAGCIEKQCPETFQSRGAELSEIQDLARLGQLTSEVSHQLRSPLGTIKTSLFAIRHRSDRDDLKLNAAIERADRGIARVIKIIDDLLCYGRGQEGVLQDTDLDDWLRSQVPTLAYDEGLNIALELGAGGHVQLDRSNFRVCLQRLLQNASDAMKDLDGERQMVSLVTRRDGDNIVIHLRDCGKGLPEEDFERVFLPLHSSKSQGVGLGLTIARQIVRRHGGAIQFLSVVEPGAKIQISLPISVAP